MSDQKAGKEGVVLASLGTIAELSKLLIELIHYRQTAARHTLSSAQPCC